MNSYKSSAELKAMAKEQLFGNYGTVIGAFLLVTLISLFLTAIPEFVIGIDTIPGMIIYYLVNFIIGLFAGIFVSGESFMYLKLTCKQKISVSDVFYGFKVYPDKAIAIQFVISIISSICLVPTMIFNALFMNEPTNGVYMLLMTIFMIVGMLVSTVISLMFSQAFFLLQDFPQYSAKELLKMSCQIMKGHKGRLFYIQLSFVPLFLLGIFSCCIAFLWIIPYMNAVMSNFYMDLMTKRKATGADTVND